MSAPPRSDPQAGVRLAELMAALSVATDLAMGQPMEHAMATAVATVRLGQAAGLGIAELRDAYYQALLRYIGCNADVTWLAAVAGDDIALRRQVLAIDGADTGAALALLLRTLREAHGGLSVRFVRAALRSLGELPKLRTHFFPGHCEVASRLAERLGFPASFVIGVGQLYARWDGQGVPALRADAISIATQVVAVAQDSVLFLRGGGLSAVHAMLAERRGRAHAPRFSDLMVQQAPAVLAGLDRNLPWEAVLEAEPGTPVRLSEWQFDAACEAMGDYADLRSPHHLGHARRVARLAEAAATALGWPVDQVARVRRAAWLHDLGRTGVPASVGAHPGPLTEREREQIRLHPYYTERILTRSPMLADLGRLAALHHERLDSSGYAKGLPATALDRAARLLAVADRYCALGEPRDHRAALDGDAAAEAVRRDAAEGRLDHGLVEAVLGCAGHAPARRALPLPGPLSERECEVLRLLARGGSIKEVARELGLAVKTVDRHTQNIYAKVGVRTRAAATLWAVEQGLLD